MAKLKLIANPTFTTKVAIPVAGGDAIPMAFTFKHRTRTELDAFGKGLAQQSDADAFLEMLTGWEFDEEFNKENIELLLQNYQGAAMAVYDTYKNELVKAKVKN